MNRIYRSIWNSRTATFVAASENSGGGRNPSSSRTAAVAGAIADNPLASLKALAISVLLAFAPAAWALPTGGVVSAGNASIANGTGTTTINQASQNAAINWQGFSIATSEAVRFVQPGSSSVALNRVLGPDPSSILGSLSANGKVFLVNPNGILFGQGAQVNVGGLVASTRNITDSDFMAGTYKFSGSGAAGVVNRGTINADGGFVALLGANVSNEGVISAKLGTIALAAGNAMTLDLAGDGLLNVAVTEGAVNALAQNGGLIRADGGQVLLTAMAAGGLMQGVVNNTGIIQAQTVENRNGTIRLMGDMQDGSVNVGGTLDASAPNGGNGGFIEASAARVNIADNAQITTFASTGTTGTFLIDPQDFFIGPKTDGTPGNITGPALSALLVTNSVSITTNTGPDTNVAGTPPVSTRNTSTVGNGDIFVNEAVSWTATPSPTTLTLTAQRDVNINFPISATNGNLVVCCGRDVNVRAAITTATPGGSVLLAGGNNVTLFSTGAITTNSGNLTMCAGNDVIVDGKIVMTNVAPGPTLSLGLANGLVLSAGNNGTGPGVAGGTVKIALRVDPSTLTDAPVTIIYNPTSYTTPTDYSSATLFVRTRSPMTQKMLVFPDGADKVFDGTTSAVFTGLKNLPANVTLVAGVGNTAAFDTPDVGVAKTVTFTGYSLTGTNAAAFALPSTCCGTIVGKTTATITAAPVVIPPEVIPAVVVAAPAVAVAPVAVIAPVGVVAPAVEVAPGIVAAPVGALPIVVVAAPVVTAAPVVLAIPEDIEVPVEAVSLPVFQNFVESEIPLGVPGLGMNIVEGGVRMPPVLVAAKPVPPPVQVVVPPPPPVVAPPPVAPPPYVPPVLPRKPDRN